MMAKYRRTDYLKVRDTDLTTNDSNNETGDSSINTEWSR